MIGFSFSEYWNKRWHWFQCYSRFPWECNVNTCCLQRHIWTPTRVRGFCTIIRPFVTKLNECLCFSPCTPSYSYVTGNGDRSFFTSVIQFCPKHKSSFSKVVMSFHALFSTAYLLSIVFARVLIKFLQLGRTQNAKWPNSICQSRDSDCPMGEADKVWVKRCKVIGRFLLVLIVNSSRQ